MFKNAPTRNKQIYFYLIVIGLFLIIISPDLLSDGMFVDGLMYAAIAKNLANGIGSFWDLHLSDTLDPHFFAHPPLAFGLQSLGFKLFGDSLLVERIYSISTFFITGIIIIQIWKQVVEKTAEQLSWLPLLLWGAIPLVNWAASNNMLENSMMIFTSLAILWIIKSRTKHQLVYLCLSGISVFLAFLTKGFVGLFPLATLFWIFIFDKKRNVKQFVFQLFILLSSTLFPLLVLFLFVPESSKSLLAYFDLQVVGSISNVQTVSSRFFILGRLIAELLPPGIIGLLFYLATKNITFTNIKNKWIGIFFCLGLSGVVPIMISLKQSGFYILASFPVFSIAIALLIKDRVNYVVNKIPPNSKALKIISISIFTISIFLNIIHINSTGREKEKVADVHQILKYIPANRKISIPLSLKKNQALYGYFARYGNVSLDTLRPFQQYIVIEKENKNVLLDDFKKIDLDLKMYDLYKKKSPLSQ